MVGMGAAHRLLDWALRDHDEFDVFGLLIRRNRSKASWALAATVYILESRQTRRLNGGSSWARPRRSLCLISCLPARVSNPRVSATGETVWV